MSHERPADNGRLNQKELLKSDKVEMPSGAWQQSMYNLRLCLSSLVYAHRLFYRFIDLLHFLNFFQFNRSPLETMECLNRFEKSLQAMDANDWTLTILIRVFALATMLEKIDFATGLHFYFSIDNHLLCTFLQESNLIK